MIITKIVGLTTMLLLLLLKEAGVGVGTMIY